MVNTYKTYYPKSSPFRTPCTTNFRHNVRMEPKDRLKIARANAGFDGPADAARAFPRQINQNTLTSNENGNRPISRKMAQKYADVFGVRAGWLLYGEEESAERSDVDVPLLSTVSAGNLREQDGISDTDVIRWIKIGELPRGEWVALQVEGDSMNRIAPEGAIILIDRRDDRLLDGKFYVFSLGNGEATFKMFKRADRDHPNRLSPYSTNPDHMAITADRDDLYVFGRVKRIIQDV